MADLNLKNLVAKLDNQSRLSLEQAVGYAVSLTHYQVDIEHWLLKIIDLDNSDFEKCLRHFEIDMRNFKAELEASLGRLKISNDRAPSLSSQVIMLAREAWLSASLDYGLAEVSTAHLLIALLKDDYLKRVIADMCPSLKVLSVDELQNRLSSIINLNTKPTVSSPESPTIAPKPGQAALSQYTIDITELARQGKIDPVIGRESEIHVMIDILTRRRQNNPIIVGEAGVGKTAIVEGFALKIIEQSVPEALQNVSIKSLDMGLLQAGAGVKGEFENRLKQVIQEVKQSPTPIILFVDEAHTLIGAGGQQGQGDAANLLKPALARGELRTIAATTWNEYKKYIEPDPALTRRFQVVKAEEPSEEQAVRMMRGMLNTLEEHHNVVILNEAVAHSVSLAKRYIADRQLPDKSLSLLDTACAKVAMSQQTIPAKIEACEQEIAQITNESELLKREQLQNIVHQERLNELEQSLLSNFVKLDELKSQWEKEKILFTEIRDLRNQLISTTDTDKITEITSSINIAKQSLEALQAESPLIHDVVNKQVIAEIVAQWTGIPVGKMHSSEIQTILNLKQTLQNRIVGQDHALDAIAQCMQISTAKLSDRRKPIGVFLFAGTSGVGKTETALALAEQIYGSERNLTVINMSEFKEEHKVSLLLGSPPGYVGYGEGGVLTEAVRRKPYSLILLDEMEKAHPGVQDIFYQVFDKGILKDGQGRDIDFKNTVIIMTTNAASEKLTQLFYESDGTLVPSQLNEAIKPELLKFFKPAFLGRVNIIPFLPLSSQFIENITRLQLNKVKDRVKESYNSELQFDNELIHTIAQRCNEVDTGARTIEHIISGSLLPELAVHFLSEVVGQNDPRPVKIAITNGAFQCVNVPD